MARQVVSVFGLGSVGLGVAYTPYSAINIWLKDLGIVRDVAKASQFLAPLTAKAVQQFVAAAWQGFAGEGNAAVANVYAHNANIKLPKYG